MPRAAPAYYVAAKGRGGIGNRRHTSSTPLTMLALLVLLLALSLALATASEVQHERGHQCFDGKDNDGDGMKDCADPDCLKDRRIGQRCRYMSKHPDNPNTETRRECFDHKDNDGDGKTDCADPDCLKDRRVGQLCRMISAHGGHWGDRGHHNQNKCCQTCTCQAIVAGDQRPCTTPPAQMQEEQRQCQGKCADCHSGNGEYPHGGDVDGGGERPPQLNNPPGQEGKPCNDHQKQLIRVVSEGTSKRDACDADLDVLERRLKRCTIDGIVQVFGESFCANTDGGGGTPSNTNAGHDIGGRDGGEAHKCGAEQIKIIKDLGTCGAGTPTEIASVQRWISIDGQACSINGVLQKFGVTFCIRKEPTTTYHPVVDAADAKGVVESTQVDRIHGYTTYRLKLQLGGNAKSIYTIYGDKDKGGPMVFPPAFQVAQPFGANIGGSSPHLFSMKRDSEWDSWLTVGPTKGETPSALSSVGIDFAHWSESHGIHTGNTGGAVFWMDPNDGPTMEDNNGKAAKGALNGGAIPIAQLTVKSGSSFVARLNAQGHTKSGDNFESLGIKIEVIGSLGTLSGH